MENRSEMEERIFPLIERMHTGKIHFSPESKRLANSFSKIRQLPNGRLDLQTIDSGIRSTMWSLSNNMEDSNEDTDNQNEAI